MIDSFTGRYEFLSNFFELPVVYDGIKYRNSEAAFQAQKTEDRSIRKEFADLPPNLAKRKGRHVTLRPDWDIIKDSVMYMVCRCKFEQNPVYLEKLLETGDAELVEGNTWGDTYWGVCNGVGENQLGKTLMRIRSEYRFSRSAPTIEDYAGFCSWLARLLTDEDDEGGTCELICRKLVRLGYLSGLDGSYILGGRCK